MPKTNLVTENYSEYTPFYELPKGCDLKEITDDLLNSPIIQDIRKKSMRTLGRRTFLFAYPSDGLKIKGLISFVPNPEQHPLIVLLRGGNRYYGLVNPGGNMICADECTVVTTTYRGGVSEGQDEFGGADLNDVKNLIDFIPQLEEKLAIQLQETDKYLVGGSRGGMQMFLALSSFPELQSYFSKFVSLSGLLDMRECLLSRPDMKKMFVDDFGLIETVNEEEWINYRDPLLAAEKLDPTLPLLIIQGTKDIRVTLIQGYNMVNKLQNQGNSVTYWEIEDGEHCLINREDRMSIILDWCKLPK